ncbi:Protein of unknown function (DUF1399) domain containing protein [Rhypophila decipiens]
MDSGSQLGRTLTPSKFVQTWFATQLPSKEANMPLVCYETNDALHQCGRQVLLDVLDAKTAISYKIATQDEEKPVIPDLDVFRSDDSSATDKKPFGALPTVGDCAIHLEFLETLFVLRQKIFRSNDIDKAMGIALAREKKTGFKGDTKELKDTTFETRRRKKWPKYTEFAVIRFIDWMENLPANAGPDIKLPPLDILMVWHAFLLNPLLFHNHCRHKPIYKLPFPWAAIHAHINNNDWSFQHPGADMDAADTGDLYDILSKWTTHIGEHGNSLLASTFSLSSLPSDDSLSALSDSLKDCSHSQDNPILHHANIVRKLRQETDYLPPIVSSLPTPPAPNTTPQSGQSSSSTAEESKPEPALANELFDAVLRQNSFIDKMSNHLWIRSPALRGTLRRSIERYSKFLQLLRLDNKIPGRSGSGKRAMMVPTLDIDLAWHTHQCSGGRPYMMATKSLVGRFINHDDKIGDAVLGDGSVETRRLWRLLFGSEYRICGCWDCEMLIDEVEAAVANTGEIGISMKEVVARVERVVTYYRAVEAARRSGKSTGMPKKLELQ